MIYWLLGISFKVAELAEDNALKAISMNVWNTVYEDMSNAYKLLAISILICDLSDHNNGVSRSCFTTNDNSLPSDHHFTCYHTFGPCFDLC